MELVVLVNSPVGDGPDGQFLYTLVADAYISHIEEIRMPPITAAAPA